jgi:DNA repair photolyase
MRILIPAERSSDLPRALSHQYEPGFQQNCSRSSAARIGARMRAEPLDFHSRSLYALHTLANKKRIISVSTAMSTLPLLYGPDDLEEPKPRLVGIAKLASEGDFIREGHEVEFFTLNARTLLNRCTAPYMPFSWTINPYRGCEFACKYCYARYTHEFMELGDEDFEHKIYVKQHAAELLRRDLRKVKPGEEIAIGTATDPYQPAERRYEVTRAILEVMVAEHGLQVGIVTKSDLVLRDIDLFQQISRRNKLFINLTVTTTDMRLARILEPRAPRPDLRLSAVQKLVESSVDAGVICAPVIPGITDGDASLEAVVRATAEAGGRHIFANALFLKPCSAAIFMPFLEREFPELAEDYRQRFEQRSFLPTSYRRKLSERMSRLRKKYGFSGREDRYTRRATRASKFERANGTFELIAGADTREPVVRGGGCAAPAGAKRPPRPAPLPLLEEQFRLF